jgi:hypothetical protein
MFYLFFHTYVASVLSRCCVCFTMVLRCFCKYFRCMFHVSFRRMLQVLHLDVSKVERVFASRSLIVFSCLASMSLLLSASAGHSNQRHRWAPPPPLLLDADSVAWDGGVAGDGPLRVARAYAPSIPWFRYTSGRAHFLLRYSVDDSCGRAWTCLGADV